MIKNKLIIPTIGILIILVLGITGCYERVEVEDYDYDQSRNVVTLNGVAPTRDFLERILVNKDTLSTSNPSLEFRFYRSASDNWDNEDTSIHETVEKDSVQFSDGYAYFSAEIDDLNPDTRYHVRAFGYYFNADPDIYEHGWAYSEMFSFTPSNLDEPGHTSEINIIKNNGFIEIEALKDLIQKNPGLKEIILQKILS